MQGYLWQSKNALSHGCIVPSYILREFGGELGKVLVVLIFVIF